jgi:hypothetical protein
MPSSSAAALRFPYFFVTLIISISFCSSLNTSSSSTVSAKDNYRHSLDRFLRCFGSPSKLSLVLLQNLFRYHFL